MVGTVLNVHVFRGVDAFSGRKLCQNVSKKACTLKGNNLLPNITKTCLYNVDPLKPHFYIANLGFTGVYIFFLISTQKHRL